MVGSAIFGQVVPDGLRKAVECQTAEGASKPLSSVVSASGSASRRPPAVVDSDLSVNCNTLYPPVSLLAAVCSHSNRKQHGDRDTVGVGSWHVVWAHVRGLGVCHRYLWCAACAARSLSVLGL